MRQIMSEEWRGLGDEQKKPFIEESEQNKKRYEAEMKVYKAKLAEQPKPKEEAKKVAKTATKETKTQSAGAKRTHKEKSEGKAKEKTKAEAATKQPAAKKATPAKAASKSAATTAAAPNAGKKASARKQSVAKSAPKSKAVAAAETAKEASTAVHVQEHKETPAAVTLEAHAAPSHRENGHVKASPVKSVSHRSEAPAEEPAQASQENPEAEVVEEGSLPPAADASGEDVPEGREEE